jgi:hypothetical protein
MASSIIWQFCEFSMFKKNLTIEKYCKYVVDFLNTDSNIIIRNTTDLNRRKLKLPYFYPKCRSAMANPHAALEAL